jgi:hypothetical protein
MPPNQKLNNDRQQLIGIIKKTVLHKSDDYKSMNDVGSEHWISYTLYNYKEIADMICNTLIHEKDLLDKSNKNKALNDTDLLSETRIYKELKDYCINHHIKITKKINEWVKDDQFLKKFSMTYIACDSQISNFNNETCNGLLHISQFNKIAFKWLWYLYDKYINENVCDDFNDYITKTKPEFYTPNTNKPIKYVNVGKLVRLVYNNISNKYIESEYNQKKNYFR